MVEQTDMVADMHVSFMNDFRKSLARTVLTGGVALMVAMSPAMAGTVLGPAGALAASQPLVPGRCFAQVGVDHVVFGPTSFFEPKTVQGPTSFKEDSGPTTVTYPLYQGTSQGRTESYVITDASDLSVAITLRVNYAPKLARTARTGAVQNSTSRISSGDGIDFPASVNFASTLWGARAGFAP